MPNRQFKFEDNYQEIDQKIKELRELSENMSFDLNDEIDSLGTKMKNIREKKYQQLTPWEKVLLSRHPQRPSTPDYIGYMFTEWVELFGDRLFSNDNAIAGGIALFEGQPVTILGHQKGKDINQRISYNFGMPFPEGYRKAKRLLYQAEKFNRPVITFVDTSGANPGIGAEERGQALAIAEMLMTLSALKVPVISIVTGEGGSGGALALAVADRLLMLSNSIFSVASPEATASILMRDNKKAEEIAASLKLTAQDLLQLGIIDDIIEEPVGGAHLDFETTAARVRTAIQLHLRNLLAIDRDELVVQRYQRLRNIGRFNE